MDAVRTIRSELNGRVPLIGFSGSPWTLATYMIEGGSSKDFRRIKAMMFDQPQLLDHVLSVLADSVTSYLNAQIKAGAQAVQIFDTWGGVLSPENYRDFSLKYMQRIVDGLIRENEGRKVPVIMFTKNGGQWLEQMANTGVDALGLDWTTDLGEARQRVGNTVSLQGNMDPSTLYASPARIRQEVATILEKYGHGEGHVFIWDMVFISLLSLIVLQRLLKQCMSYLLNITSNYDSPRSHASAWKRRSRKSAFSGNRTITNIRTIISIIQEMVFTAL